MRGAGCTLIAERWSAEEGRRRAHQEAEEACHNERERRCSEGQDDPTSTTAARKWRRRLNGSCHVWQRLARRVVIGRVKLQDDAKGWPEARAAKGVPKGCRRNVPQGVEQFSRQETDGGARAVNVLVRFDPNEG